MKVLLANKANIVPGQYFAVKLYAVF